ncbi:MAG: hypothetical protein ACOX47_06050 [Bacillota bacterium]
MNIKLRHILLYLFIISVAAMGISFSRFSTTLTNSGAESTVPDIEFSTWVLDHEATSVVLENMKPGDVKTIDIWVRNWEDNGGERKISSYSQSFNLELETTGNLPLEFTLTESPGGGDLFHFDSYRYLSLDREFSAKTEETKEFTLIISWPESFNGDQYKNEIDYLELRIKAVQIESELPE